jgi:two-component sensor histidine kinase
MYRLLPTVLFAVMLMPAIGQPITRQAADSLLRSLDGGREDQDRLHAYLQLADFYIQKPGEEKADLDAASGYLEKARQLDARLLTKDGEGYIALIASYLYKERNQKPQGQQMADKAIDFFERDSNAGLLARAYFARSEYYHYNISADRQAMIGLIEKALAAYRRAGNIERQAYCLEVLTDLYLHDGKTMKALEYGKQSVEKYTAIHYPNLEGPYVLLSGAYASQEDYQQAANYILLALESAAKNKDSSLRLCQINYTAGTLYYDLRDYERSVHFFRDALLVADKHRDSVQVYVVAVSLASVYAETGHGSEAVYFLDSLARHYVPPQHGSMASYLSSIYLNGYEQMKEFTKAQVICDRLLPLVSNPHVPDDDRFYLYDVVMSFYLASGQYGKAQDSLPSFQRTVERSNSLQNQVEGCLLAFRLDTAQGRYRSSVSDLVKYNRLNDSLFNEKKSRQIQVLQTAYDFSEKARNIGLLQKVAEMQKLDLAQSRETRNFSVAGVGLSLVLLGVMFSRYQLKQRKNRLLEAKQKEITRKNLQLEKLLQENEWLLREVHHRVKNNLQVVMSLLNSQSAYLQDEKALNAVLDSQHRVQAMSLIHQKLYKSSNVSRIYMPEYVNDLVDYLRDSFNGGRRVEFHLEVPSIDLDVVQAVPVGLILNEVITNSFKHAFPHGQDDAVLIRLVDEEGEITLFVADNGRGFPGDVDAIVNNSFGRLLIHGLVEDLDGVMTVDRSDGTAYCIHFRQTVPGEKNMVAAGDVLGSQ